MASRRRGLVNGDKSATFTGKLATTAASKSPVGSYPITEGTLTATGNYTIGAFKAGTLTVKSATSTIKAINLSMTAGGAVPAFTVTYTGLVNSDTSDTLTGGLAAHGKNKLSAAGLTTKIEPVAPCGGVPTGQVTFEFVKKHRKEPKQGRTWFWI